MNYVCWVSHIKVKIYFLWRKFNVQCIYINTLWPSNAIWQHRFGSTLAQVMAYYTTAPSHYLNLKFFLDILIICLTFCSSDDIITLSGFHRCSCDNDRCMMLSWHWLLKWRHVTSQITSNSTVCSTIFSGVHQRTHQSSAFLILMKEIQRWTLHACDTLFVSKGTVLESMFIFFRFFTTLRTLDDERVWQLKPLLRWLSHIYTRSTAIQGEFCGNKIHVTVIYTRIYSTIVNAWLYIHTVTYIYIYICVCVTGSNIQLMGMSIPMAIIFIGRCTRFCSSGNMLYT